MSGITYSPDGGKSWIGPLSPEVFAQLKASGVILPEYPVRGDAGAEEYPAAAAPVPVGPDSFTWSHFISGVFTRHTQDEMVDFFCAGSSKTTPPLREVSATWPGPWVFARVLVFLILLCAGLYWGLNTYNNPKFVPTIIMVGSMSVPLCVLLFVYEMNIRRDVPFYTVMKTFMLGGVLSMLFTMVLHSHFPLLQAAYWAGPIEETAKLFAVLVVASSCRKNGILTGVLLGCAIGAGFAAFETMGYVFEALLPLVEGRAAIGVLQHFGAPPHVIQYVAQNLEQYMQACDPDEVMFERGLLAPAAHVVWTAITAGAFWMVMGEKVKQGLRSAHDTKIDFSILTDKRFLHIAWVPVVLHMVWNSGFFSSHGLLKFVGLGVVGWMLLLRLVQMGINQVKDEKIKLGL